MSEKANQSGPHNACPTPVVLFGTDSRGKPKAARFGKQHAGFALKAASDAARTAVQRNHSAR